MPRAEAQPSDRRTSQKKSSMPIVLTGFPASVSGQKQRHAASMAVDCDICVASLPVKRTLKLLNALASGMSIVSEDWLLASAAAGEALDPKPYQLTEHVPGCLVGGGLLRGLEVAIVGPTNLKADDLAALIRTAGGEVVDDLPCG